MQGCYHSNIINEYLFNMAGETEDKIPMPFENSPKKAGFDHHETILYHAGWAIKRARDVISKGQEEFPLIKSSTINGTNY